MIRIKSLVTERAINFITILASSKARNLLRPNNLSGGLTDDCVNNVTSFLE